MKKIYNRLKDKGNLMKQAVDDTRLSIDLDFNQKKRFQKCWMRILKEAIK